MTTGVTLLNYLNNLSGTPLSDGPRRRPRAGPFTTVSVQFRSPSNATINFTPVIYSGSIQLTCDNSPRFLPRQLHSGSVIGVGRPHYLRRDSQHFVDLRHHRLARFQCQSGPVYHPARLQILSFTSDGTLAEACPCGTGGCQWSASNVVDLRQRLRPQRLLRQLRLRLDDFFQCEPLRTRAERAGWSFHIRQYVRIQHVLRSRRNGSRPDQRHHRRLCIYRGRQPGWVDYGNQLLDSDDRILRPVSGGPPSGSVPEPGSFLMALGALAALVSLKNSGLIPAVTGRARGLSTK